MHILNVKLKILSYIMVQNVSAKILILQSYLPAKLLVNIIFSTYTPMYRLLVALK